MSESWDFYGNWMELMLKFCGFIRGFMGIYADIPNFFWDIIGIDTNLIRILATNWDFKIILLVVEPPGKNNPRENELGYDDPWRSMFETTKHYGEFLEKNWEKLPRKKHGDLKNHPRNSPSLSRLSSSWTLRYRQIVRIGDWTTGFLSICWVPKLDMSIFWRSYLPFLIRFSYVT